jgi:hypothetical protein
VPQFEDEVPAVHHHRPEGAKKIGAGSETRGDGKRNVRGFADVVDVTTGDAG